MFAELHFHIFAVCDYYHLLPFSRQDANMIGSNFVITGCNLLKKLNLALQTQNRVEFTILLRATYTTIWKEKFKC